MKCRKNTFILNELNEAVCVCVCFFPDAHDYCASRYHANDAGRAASVSCPFKKNEK